MDLGTVRKRLKDNDSLGYETHEAFAADVHLVFENARMDYSLRGNAHAICPVTEHADTDFVLLSLQLRL